MGAREQQLHEAGVILALLGGGTFLLATSASALAVSENGLSFTVRHAMGDMPQALSISILKAGDGRYCMKGVPSDPVRDGEIAAIEIFREEAILPGQLAAAFTTHTGLSVLPKGLSPLSSA